MMLENVVPEVMTGWASRLRQTWCQKVNAASGFNYKAAGTPVKVRPVVGDNKPTKSQEVGKRVLELKFKILQNVACKPLAHRLKCATLFLGD